MPTLAQSTQPIDPNQQFDQIPTQPTVQGPGTEPIYPSYPRFNVSSLPLIAIYQPDALRQFYRGGVPQSRIIPVQS